MEGNALRFNWDDIVPKERLDYIMENPPFSGRRYRTPEQIDDIARFFDCKDIDYMGCWFVKAASYMRGTEIQTAFVAINVSIHYIIFQLRKVARMKKQCI